MSDHPFGSVAPDQFIADFFERFRGAIVAAEEKDLATTYDRFHTPDIAQTVDGRRMGRDALIAQVREARGHAATVRIDVRDALADGDLLAARYLLFMGPEATDGTEAAPVAEGFFFGRFTADGRMRRADMATRSEGEPAASAEPEVAA